MSPRKEAMAQLAGRVERGEIGAEWSPVDEIEQDRFQELAEHGYVTYDDASGEKDQAVYSGIKITKEGRELYEEYKRQVDG